MKIRSGFVSNSSSSSFVVQIKSGWLKKSTEENDQLLISQEDYEKLISYGFKKSYIIHASHLDPYDYNDIPVHQSETFNNSLVYSVVCNQDEVIEFLVKNNIPFTASVHYGHYYLIFEKDSKEIIHLTNFGSIVETYGLEHLLESIKSKYVKTIIQRIPVEEYDTNGDI